MLPLRPYRSRDVALDTYFGGLGNLEVIRMIALSDRVFGWDDDYDVLFDASLEAIRADPGPYVRGVADTFWDFLSQRYSPEVRERPVPLPELPAELEIDGRPFPAPITVSPLIQAVRYGFVWCPTDDLERCVVRDPAAALGSASEGQRYLELVDTVRDWNAQLPTRDSNAWLASKGGTAGDRWPRPILWIAVAVVATRRPAPARDRADRRPGRVRAPRPPRPRPLTGTAERVRAPVRPRLDRRRIRRVAGAARGALVTRIEMVQRALDALGGSRYLELGVKDGACFHAVEAATKVGVDPRFAFRVPMLARARAALGARTGTLYFPTTSDAFFERHGDRLAPFDVVFVDGLHTYEQSYRDVLNALAVLRPDGVVLVHDCNPQTAAAAAPSLAEAARTDGFAGDWNGDVYRAIVRLRTDPELDVSVLDADQGVAVVTRGAPRRASRSRSTRSSGWGTRRWSTTARVSSGSVRRATSTGCSPGGARTKIAACQG